MRIRTNYNNGDEIGLITGCDGCQPLMIDGVLAHEYGCPYAWKDWSKECDECGNDFFPQESRHEKVCPDCRHVCDDDCRSYGCP